MLKIDLIVIGKLKEEYLRKACEEYEKRLRTACKLTLTELPESRLPPNPSPAEIADCIKKEGLAILSKISPQTTVIPLCIEGDMLTSPGLAQKIEQLQLQGSSQIAFLIGGSYGLDNAVKEQADFRFSMSRLTFPHQLARVMLLEQIYRALSITNHSKYHK